MAYQIGQYRFLGGGCLESVTSSINYKTNSIGASDSTSTSYKDVIIQAASSFSSGEDYYLKVIIPQDMNYEMEFNIKLYNSENGRYQFIKNVIVPKGSGSSENIYNVVLYEYDNKTVAMIPYNYNDQDKPLVEGSIYQDENKYYIYNGTNFVATDDFNDVSIIATWRQDYSGIVKGVFEMVFRPVESNFDSIVLEMYRTAIDLNLQTTNSSTGEIEFGRILDIDPASGVNYELNKINNLMPSINNGGTLSRIGVWGHTGLIMAINGEEIKIGPSGYYELDVIPIETIGIVAKNYNDNFTIDYAFDNNESSST